MKTQFLSLATLLGVFFVMPVALAVSFSDVVESDVNYEAIEFLKNESIVNGYPDGSFQPDRSLNRAELTKIVVESLGEDLVDNEDCFADVEIGSWYASYVCTAFELGLVEGYPDGLFRPGQVINRAEAVKIVMEAEGLGADFTLNSYDDVDINEWYSGYVGVAYDLNYLPFLIEFDAGEAVLRRDFAEIYFRSIVSRNVEGRVYEQGSVDKLGVYYDDVVVGDVELSQKVPKFVVEGEVYFFEGVVLESGAELQILNVEEGNKSYLGETGEDFSVPLWFGSKGVYEIKIGNKTFEILSISDLEFDELMEADVNGGAYVSTYMNDVVLNAVGYENKLKRYDFQIGENEISFVNRQAFSNIQLPNYWLKDLWSGESGIGFQVWAAEFDLDNKVRGEWALVESEVLDVVSEFEVIVNNIENEKLDFTYGFGDRIEIKFDALVESEDELFVIDASGAVRILEDRVVVNDEKVRVDYVPSNGVLYEIIEVNDVEGRALINYPIYRRNVLPLGDDPYDRVGLGLEASVENALYLLNLDRQEAGLNDLVLNDDLGELAQAHATDMALNQYVSHSDLEGRKVSERKLDYGIKTFVGENIARNLEISDAQSSLMRSAAHRINILDPNWTEVGFGIAFDDLGSLYLVQNFSFDSEIATDDIKDFIEFELGVVEDDDLKMVADGWAGVMVEFQEYGTEINGESLMERVSGLNKFVAGNSVTGRTTFVQEVEDLLSQNIEALRGDGYDYYGFDVRLGDDGILYFVLIVTS